MEIAIEPQAEMSFADYAKIPALSNSGMKDLAVSPMRFWYWHLNPDRPEREETREMRFGTALHCAVLEPERFNAAYCREINADDFEGCLVTCDDIRGWIKDQGRHPKGTRKADLIAQAQEIDANVPILDVLTSQDEQANEGKVRLSKDEWTRVQGCASALRAEPQIVAILEQGRPEVSLKATDPETGVPLKCRIDWMAPKAILDIKTFSQQRGKSIDQCVANAIYYERYFRQAWLYSHIAAIADGQDARTGAQNASEFVFAFVESEPPHEVRIRSLRPRTSGEYNVYWTTAALEARSLMRLYASCVETFGLNPWRVAQSVHALIDDEIPQLAFERNF